MNVKSLKQKCNKCSGWVEVKRAQITQLEKDVKAGKANYGRLILCQQCYTEQPLLPIIDPEDKAGRPLNECRRQHLVLHGPEYIPEVDGESQTRGLRRGTLINHRDKLLKDRDIEPPAETRATKKNLISAIREIENPPVEPKEAPKPEPILITLARLNVILAKQGKPTLKHWRDSRKELLARIEKASLDTEHVEVTVGKPKIAKGAETQKFDTGLHKNKYEAGVKRALEKKDVEVGRVLKPVKEAPRAKDADFLTPAKLAEKLGVDARDIRVVLRANESAIPQAWKVEGARWGFEHSCEEKLVKLLQKELQK